LVSDAVAGKAQATVKFVNLGHVMTVVLDLVQVRNAWRIYDINLAAERQDGDAPKDFCSLV